MDESEEKKLGEGVPILDYAAARLGEMVAIAQFPLEAEARMAACKLESEGIDAKVDDRANLWGGAVGLLTRLRVAAEDVAEAIEILKQTPAKMYLLGDS